VALSITIGGIYKFPLAFFLLSIQSLLVVTMALWFRSRFIVIMNSLLFIGLLIAYLAFADPLHSINFSFAIVALVTARILNWKKKRLEIRTELIRNIYLLTGAAMVLYSLHHAVPTQFITLSWALAAVLFFILSVLIHNIKYRWLAIMTMVVTVFYLFIIDLKNISPDVYSGHIVGHICLLYQADQAEEGGSLLILRESVNVFQTCRS
jgi:hypothetical protein